MAQGRRDRFLEGRLVVGSHIKQRFDNFRSKSTRSYQVIKMACLSHVGAESYVAT
jgi:hypothetical protein